MFEEKNKVLKADFFDISRAHWEPTYDAVEMMPDEELPTFVEFLVNLTSLKSKYSLDTENNLTVGGPTDVVLITRSDGIIWHKKKNEVNSK